MASVSKSLVLILILAMIILSLIMVEYASAQEIPQPSVPEFTLKFIHTNYLGTNRTEYDNNTITITIKNQPYTVSINGSNYQIFYDIRIKNQSSQQWTELYPIGTYYEKEFTSYLQKNLPSIQNGTPIQSNSQTTAISLTYYNPSLDSEANCSFPIMSNTTLDFQVKAVVGHSSQGWVADNLQSPVLGGHYTSVTSLDQSSNWSNAQTITIPAANSSPTPTPSVPEFPALAILSLLICMLSLGVVKLFRKPK